MNCWLQQMTFFSKEKLLGLAHDVVSKSMRIKGVSPVMVASIAMVESSGDPKAYRYEPHLGEASAGLTQVLFSTAKWLAVDLGFSEYGIPKTEKDLEQVTWKISFLFVLLCHCF